jgi:hypothetical protein
MHILVIGSPSGMDAHLVVVSPSGNGRILSSISVIRIGQMVNLLYLGE